MKLLIASKEACELFMQGAVALSQMESNGIRVDMDYLNKAISETESKIKELEKKLRNDRIYLIWKKRYGSKTNLDSGNQLGKVIFQDMGFTPREKTPTGRPKTDEVSLSNLKSELPFIDRYFKVKKLKKAVNTYLKGIQKEVVDGYLHAFFNLHNIVTYRSSSDSPNLQNFPVRNKLLSELIKKSFIPRKGRVLVEIDFSGIEVKIAYCYHKDPVMKEYLTGGGDMHKDMAAQCYLLDTEQVSKQSRYCAKNMFVFPQFYGDYYVNCARSLWEAIDKLELKIEGSDTSLTDHLAYKGIKQSGEFDHEQRPKKGSFEEHIKKVEKDFWGRRFKVYKQWKDSYWNEYQRTGSFRTLTGFAFNGFGKGGLCKRNEVLNYPVQSVAFHCLLWSIIELQKWISKYKLDTKLVAEIHDSLIADVPIDELQDFLNAAHCIMTKKLLKCWQWIITPLEIEVDVTPIDGSWFNKIEWVKKGGLWQEKK